MTFHFIIQHIDTLPKYGHKLLMYVGLHDVHPVISYLWEKKTHGLLDKSGKRKKRGKLLIT